MKNRCGQRRVRVAFAEYFEKSFWSVRAAGSDHGNGDGARNCGGQRAIESRARAVLVHGGDQYFSGAGIHSLPRPRDRIDSSGHAAAAHECFPMIADALGVNRKHDGLRAEFRGERGQQRRIADRRSVYGDFVRARAEMARPSSTLATPPPAVSGIASSAATRRIVSRNVGR